jgi:hypothetical protein
MCEELVSVRGGVVMSGTGLKVSLGYFRDRGKERRGFIPGNLYACKIWYLLSFAYCGVHVKNIGCRRSVMHAVIRSYSGKGTKALFDLLEKNKGEVESLIRGVKGFVSYSLVRTTRGGFSVSVYQDKAGADESTRAAREWIAKNASKTGVARPTISEGTVMLQLK